jgi:hypothetical protein
MAKTQDDQQGYNLESYLAKNMERPKFATTPTPNHFNGEDVIGEEIYGGRQQNTVSRIPNQLLQKLQNSMQNTPAQYEEYQQQEFSIEDIQVGEGITIKHPLNLSVSNNSQRQEVIVKTIKINLEIDLKINVV